MRIKLFSSELGHMVKTVSKCLSSKNPLGANIEISHDDNVFRIKASDGQIGIVMSTPLLGGDGESFCIDGNMFSKVIGMTNKEIEITTDSKACTIKGLGRTRIPFTSAKIPNVEPVIGTSFVVNAEEFARCYENVRYAVSTDATRLVLTGVLIDVSCGKLQMVALDGFQLSMEEIDAHGDDARIVLPNSFMNVLCAGSLPDSKIKISTNGKIVVGESDGITVKASLLTGEYPDYQRLIPGNFKTESLVNVNEMMDTLKAGSMVNNKQNLVKLEIGSNIITVKNNSEVADFVSEVSCQTNGDLFTIAFNERYLISTFKAVETENAIMDMNGPVSPIVIKGENSRGLRLVLPVRTR